MNTVIAYIASLFELCLPYLAWASSVVVLITAWAMLQDAHRAPYEHSARGWTQHLCRLSVLVALAAIHGVLVVAPAMWGVSDREMAARILLAMFMAIQSPCPWWRYVFQDRRHAHVPSFDLKPFR